MQAVSNDDIITKTYEDVRVISFNQKKSPFLSELEINSFLDAVLKLKDTLSKSIGCIANLNTKFEEFTWKVNVDEIDEASLMAINVIISITKDLHSTLIRQYVNMAILRQKGIAIDEIKDFKYQIDVLKESFMDFESIYFNLPQMPQFTQTTKELSLIA